jgi:copper chaperone CopZ
MAKKEIQETYQDTVVVTLEAGYTDKEGVKHTEFEIRDIQGVDEEAISANDVRTNIGRVITVLLANTTVRVGDLTPKEIGKGKWEKIFRDMKMGDRDKLLLELHKLSKGNEMELDMKCPHCKGKIKHIVDADEDIEYKELEVDVDKIPFELPRGFKNKDGEICKTGYLRLPDGMDQESLDAVARKNPGQANTALLARALIELKGEDSITQAMLRKMSTRDREYLIKLIADSGFGPKYLVEFPCPHCAEDVEAGVHPVNFL